MIPVSGYATHQERDEIVHELKTTQPGLLMITKGGPKSLAQLLNDVQGSSRVPLLTGMNAEWGANQALDSILSFQPALIQSSLASDSLNEMLGESVGEQLRWLGVHINFAPRLDAFENQVDYLNCFSNDKDRLYSKSAAFTRGLQKQGILACAKLSGTRMIGHVPADTTAFFDVSELDTLGLSVPLQWIHAGSGALLTNHFNFSIQEPSGKKKPVPASLSQIFISEILKKKFGFHGLAFTDIPSLQAISSKTRRGEIEALAFLVGNDVLINPQNPSAAIKRIRKAIKKEPVLMAQLDASVKKILGAKYDAGLSEDRLHNTDNLLLRLNRPEVRLLRHQLAEASVTVLENPGGFIPVVLLDNRQFVSVSIGKDVANEFNRYLGRYAPFRNFAVRNLSDTTAMVQQLGLGDVIVVSVYSSGATLQKDIIPVLRRAAGDKTLIICHFGNPLDLKLWLGLGVLVAGYSEDDFQAQVAAQVIFGGLGARGVLPVRLSDSLTAGFGLNTAPNGRLSYTLPEAARMSSRVLDKIRPIALEAITNKATPGCRVLVAKDGKVVYDESFGWLTYDKNTPVTDETIYDLASLTKVSATLQTVMFMQEKGLIDINKKLSVYLPELKETDKKDFTIKDILTHQAGLWPFLPFWLQTMKDSTYLPEYYSHHYSPDFPYTVSENLFASRSIKDSLWRWVVNAKIVKKTERTPYTYRYSDMAFYMMQHLAEKMLNQPLEDFLDQNIYEPLGASTTGYLPRNRFPAARIAPTENDKTFRKSLLVGYVHDQGAALFGGIAGHAGLFSTANDLVKLCQMWLQKGTYGGHRYFKPETLELFTQQQYETSRRGLGWDRPIASDPDGPTSLLASQKTFGHTGFTGTCIWIDPEFNLIYIFLSNRVNPDANNNKIANVRPRIQSVLYESIFSYCEDHNR